MLKELDIADSKLEELFVDKYPFFGPNSMLHCHRVEVI